jgi:disulfide oxidoreductase YuzD
MVKKISNQPWKVPYYDINPKKETFKKEKENVAKSNDNSGFFE